jgi:hypothetical protein
MPDVPLPPLSRARELKINELSQHFANDDLSLDELERRIEQVYKAATMAELDAITADLRSAAPAPADPARAKLVRGRDRTPSTPATHEVANTRLLSLMSSTKRVGRWAVPRKLDVVAIMSDTKIDMTHAAMPAGVVDFEVRAVMASLKLIVPPGMRVIIDTHSVMSNIRSRADELPAEDAPATATAPVLRLTGFALMSDVKVVVRRREDAVYYDDDDDD